MLWLHVGDAHLFHQPRAMNQFHLVILAGWLATMPAPIKVPTLSGAHGAS